MAGFPKDICFCITRIRSRFVDSTGHVRQGIATGIWISTDKGNHIFVVNEHSLDISLKYTLPEKPTLISIEIEIRKKESNQFTNQTKFFHVNLSSSNIIHGNDVDLALIINPPSR